MGPLLARSKGISLPSAFYNSMEAGKGQQKAQLLHGCKEIDVTVVVGSAVEVKPSEFKILFFMEGALGSMSADRRQT